MAATPIGRLSSCALGRAVILITLALLTPPQVTAQPNGRFTVTDLGTLAGATSLEALAVNNDGVIVGVAYFGNNASSTAFRWENGVMTPLSALSGATFTSATGIDDSGNICGTSGSFAVRWSPGGVISSLGTLGGNSSFATGIHSSAVAGAAQLANFELHAMDHISSTMNDRGTLPGGSLSLAWDITWDRVICGESDDAGGVFQGFVSSLAGNGWMRALPPISGDTYSSAQAVDGTGSFNMVTWFSVGPVYQRAYLSRLAKTDGTIISTVELGFLSSTQITNPDDINRHLQIVGYGRPLGNDTRRAFIWEGGRMSDLNTLIPQTSGWVLQRATAINDKGWIVGYGQKDGQQRAFLLRPNLDNGVILVPRLLSPAACYVLNPYDGSVITSFPINALVTSPTEFIDGHNSAELLGADFVQDDLFRFSAEGDPIGQFTSGSPPDVRGIARSIAGWTVGAGTGGFLAWSPAGVYQPTALTDALWDVEYAQIGNRRFYIVSNQTRGNVQGYDLDLNLLGQTPVNGVVSPRQVCFYNNNLRFAVVGASAGRVYKFSTATAGSLGSFLVGGVPTGVIRLDNGQFLVSTSQNLKVYTDGGTFVRDVMPAELATGYQFFARSANFTQ